MENFKDVITMLGQGTALGAAIGVPAKTVGQWSVRDNIPSRYWHLIVARAQEIGATCITFEALGHLAGRRRKRKFDHSGGNDDGRPEGRPTLPD